MTKVTDVEVQFAMQLIQPILNGLYFDYRTLYDLIQYMKQHKLITDKRKGPMVAKFNIKRDDIPSVTF